MRASRKGVWPYLAVAALAMLLGAGAFTERLGAQSAAMRAIPESERRTDRAAAAGEGGLERRAITDPSANLKCAVEEWIAERPKPSLVVVCPPDDVFAPLRLYFKLSWRRDADVPENVQIIAERKSMIKMHWNSHGDFQVLLPTERKDQRGHRPEWINFNNLVGVYIMSADRTR
jgi:hypothetical protein